MSCERSVVFLRDQRGELVEALLADGIAEQHLVDVEERWRPMLEASRASRRRLEHAHWNWRAKMAAIRTLLAYRSFAVEQAGVTQGLMSVSTTESARLADQKGKPLIYVEYLEVAPWNLRQVVAEPRLVGVGTVLLAAAITLSMEEGFRGRIGLHSLPQSETFYHRCGLEALGLDPAKESLCYFEMTADAALRFLGRKE